LPLNPKDYVHRVGRTARAGRAGRSLSIITQYDVELVQRIEHLIEKKLIELYVNSEQVMSMKESVD
jgi:ATP-dependent RNA helicase DDX47/RRP3